MNISAIKTVRFSGSSIPPQQNNNKAPKPPEKDDKSKLLGYAEIGHLTDSILDKLSFLLKRKEDAEGELKSLFYLEARKDYHDVDYSFAMRKHYGVALAKIDIYINNLKLVLKDLSEMKKSGATYVGLYSKQEKEDEDTSSSKS